MRLIYGPCNMNGKFKTADTKKNNNIKRKDNKSINSLKLKP